MFYLISKLFTFLLMPIGILLVLVVSMLISKNHTKVKRLGYLTFLLTFLFSNPYLIKQLTRIWEMPAKKIELLHNYDIGIVLTSGLINSNSRYPTNLHLTGGSDRLWQTLQLYKYGKIKTIIISGGDVSILTKIELTQIEYAKQFLIKNGVASKNIILEDKSRNTFENAKYTKSILSKIYPNGGGKLLLITSSYHLRRALACFEKQGIKVDYFPTNPIASNQPFDINFLIPNSHAFSLSELILKEIIGFMIYKTTGYA